MKNESALNVHKKHALSGLQKQQQIRIQKQSESFVGLHMQV